MKSRAFGLSIAALILIFDQLSKWIVTGPLALAQVGQIEIVSFFRLTYTQNFGISGGFLHATNDTIRWMLVAMTSAIAIGVAVWIGREKHRADQLALGLVLGGALGNIIDRSRIGYVVDFADLHFGEFRPFLIFNVGDAAISIGVVILLLRAFLLKKESPEENVEHA
ncbi:MAG: signal peptidase II [Sphingomicrobium sp.]